MGRGRAPCCEKVGLNKGSWTPEEDIRLVAYIRKYGHGNWRALPKQAGLLRCGKSCRLRWINYLRPDIKRGHFSKEEEDTVIKLHRLLGNKWSKIASCLPGRTDNEIKNVWNTHLKKRLIKLKEDDQTPQPPPTTSISLGTEDPPSSPYSGTTYISLSVEAKSSIADGAEVLSMDKIEIPTELCLDLWDALESSSLSFPPPPPVAAEAEADDYDLLDIPIDPDLWSDVAGASAADACDDSQRWVAYLEEELGLFGGGGSGEEMMVTEGCDPVRSYFQKRPSSPSLIELVDHCCLDGLS